MTLFPGFPREVARRIMAVPWFERRLNASGLLPGELLDGRSIQQFPWIFRSDLSDAVDDFVFISDDARPVYTTGTTGYPFRIYRGQEDEARFWRVLSSALDLSRSIKGGFLCMLSPSREYRWQRRLDEFEVTIERIAVRKYPDRALHVAQKSTVVLSSPLIVPWLRERGLDHVALYTTALPMSHLQLLPRHLHAYSTTETGPIAILCRESGDYHVLSDVFVESAGSNRFAVTKLFPSALPLVRYVTDDHGVIQNDPCACGFVGTSIVQLRGRKF